MTLPSTQHGKPAGDFAQPFVPFTAGEVADLSSSLYGIEVSREPRRLATERDDTFRLTTEQGQFIFKAAHPSDEPDVIDLQTEAVRHAARQDPQLPLQSVLPSLCGESAPRVPRPFGPDRMVRVLTFIPGTMLRDVTPTPEQLRLCGSIQARLAVALSNFEHPASDRRLLFDLRNFSDLREFLKYDDSNEIKRIYRWFDETLLPQAHKLPTQVLHTDFSLDNVVVDTDAPEFVRGILDWGDVMTTWRAGDLASALASQVAVEGAPWEGPAHMIAGYQSINELSDLELELLPGLVSMRIAQRILMAFYLSSKMPGNEEYLLRNIDFSYKQLANIVL